MNRRDNSVQASPSVPRKVRAYTNRITSPIIPPPPPPPPSSASSSSASSRQVSPLPSVEPARYRPFYQRALMYGIPIGAAAVLGSKYGNRIFNTMKELANYGKRLSVNALAALRGTPYSQSSPLALGFQPGTSVLPTPTPSATSSATPLPLPTPDKHHPKTSIQ